MSERSVIVIGAGLAGLSAGCYGRMNGYRTRIFERQGQPGGVVVAWSRQGYLIDGGMHFLLGCREGTAPYKVYREIGAASCPLTPMGSYFHYIDEQYGVDATVCSDLDQVRADLLAIGPDDAPHVDRLIAGARAVRDADLWSMMESPPELVGRWAQLGLLWRSRNLLPFYAGESARPVSEFVAAMKSPALRRLVEALFMPEVPLWFLYMLLGALASGQAHLLTEGSPSFVRPIEKRYRDLGGEVAYDATVESILVENDAAVGVRLDDGTEHRADVVISAADGRSTIFGMLGGRYLDEDTRDRYRSWPLFRPTVMVALGVAREFPGSAHHQGFRLREPIDIGPTPAESLWLRVFNQSPSFAPAGHTSLLASFETDWDYWNDLQAHDRPGYDAAKRRAADAVISALERHYPGIAGQVEMTDVATPYTTWRYTRNHRGSPEGWMPTPEVIMANVKRTLPGLGNFVMAGQWVMPGGGVPPCIYSGRHAIQILCKRDGKSFRTSDP